MAELTPITPSPVVRSVRKIEPEPRQKKRREEEPPQDDAEREQNQEQDGPAQHIDEIV